MYIVIYLNARLSRTELVVGGIGTVTERLLTTDRSSSLATTSRSNEFVSRKTFTKKPDSKILAEIQFFTTSV